MDNGLSMALDKARAWIIENASPDGDLNELNISLKLRKPNNDVVSIKFTKDISVLGTV
jgi:hypothetical protein